MEKLRTILSQRKSHLVCRADVICQFFSEMNQIILHLPQNEATRIICFIGGAVKFLS